MQRTHMRLLIFLAATVSTAAGQGGDFSGTAFDLETGRTQVISGTIEDPDRTHNERMSAYRRMNAELETSINSMRQESQLQEQTYEMQKQTRLLEDMAERAANQPSTPPTVVVNPVIEYSAPEPIYVGAVETVSTAPSVATESGAPDAYVKWAIASVRRSGEMIAEMRAIYVAQRARTFGRRGQAPKRERMPAGGMEFSAMDKNSNEQLIKAAVQSYKGGVTNYRWRAERIDDQTHLVICEVTLDGKRHDFRFEVNSELETCMYLGGAAFDELKPTASLSLWPPW